MPAHTDTRIHPTAAGMQGVSRHRVDRRDELCQRVPSAKRWVAVEIGRTTTGVRVHVTCGDQSVTFAASERTRQELPAFAADALAYLGLSELLNEEEPGC